MSQNESEVTNPQINMAEYLGLKVPFSDSDLARYTQFAKDYAMLNGLVLKRGSDPTNSDVTGLVPLTLLPSCVPRIVFEDLKQIQCAYLDMYYKVAHDFDFLEKCLKPVAEVDPFIGKLWKIHESVKEKPTSKHRCLLLSRNDFMLDTSTSTPAPKQIEMNLIASSFGGLGTRLKKYHEFVLQRMECADQSTNIPESRLDENFARAMLDAWRVYANKKAAILFLIEDVNRNVYDQKYLEHAIFDQNCKVKVVRAGWMDLFTNGAVRDGALFLGDLEICVVYFRRGYSDNDYDTDMSVKVREMIESSNAILCPCIHGQLAGCKKVQQVLCEEGAVEKYVKDAKMAARIRQTFANQYPTDQSPQGDQAVKLAFENPERFVLKPQSEGGGHNFYGKDIIPILKDLEKSDERGKFVLMERVFPRKYPNYLLPPEQGVRFGETISELGMYASCLGHGEGKTETNYCGQIFRTKLDGLDEGGVMIGISSLDSLLLV